MAATSHAPVHHLPALNHDVFVTADSVSAATGSISSVRLQSSVSRSATNTAK
jgi:hypothetical protein